MSDRPETADLPTTDWTPVDDAIAAADAVGFVAVGGRFDSDIRYLVGVGPPERAAAVVRIAERSVLCPPSGYVTRAERRFDGRVATERVGEPAGERAAAVLDAEVAEAEGSADAAATVVVPPTIPHDAAVYLERAGYELESTAVVADARATKSAAEIDAIATVQRAAAAGISAAERMVAAADVGDDSVRASDGHPLTTERLRRAINAELATHGVTDADNTLVIGGPGERGMPGVGSGDPDTRIRTGDPVAIAVAPRGPHGYHGFVSQTFVVDSDGGWERRAYVAVESALDAALAEIEAGAVAAAVGREARAELAAFGFDPGTEAGVDGPAEPGHGVGISRRERPWLDTDTELDVGNVVAVEPQVADSEQGVVRLSALVAVTENGYDRLGDGNLSFSPQE